MTGPVRGLLRRGTAAPRRARVDTRPCSDAERRRASPLLHGAAPARRAADVRASGTSARAPRPTPLGIPLLRSNAADPMSPAADGFRSAMDVAIPKRTRIGECAAISPTHTNASPTRRQREEAAQTCTGCLCRSSGVGVGHGAVARYSGAADSVLASQTPEVAPAALSDSGGRGIRRFPIAALLLCIGKQEHVKRVGLWLRSVPRLGRRRLKVRSCGPGGVPSLARSRSRRRGSRAPRLRPRPGP